MPELVVKMGEIVDVETDEGNGVNDPLDPEKYS